MEDGDVELEWSPVWVEVEYDASENVRYGVRHVADEAESATVLRSRQLRHYGNR